MYGREFVMVGSLTGWPARLDQTRLDAFGLDGSRHVGASDDRNEWAAVGFGGSGGGGFGGRRK